MAKPKRARDVNQFAMVSQVIALAVICTLDVGCKVTPSASVPPSGQPSTPLSAPLISTPVTFRMVDAETHQPLPGVTVEQNDNELGRFVVGKSDADGLIRVQWPAHRYFGFKMDGYLPSYAEYDESRGHIVRVLRMKSRQEFNDADVVSIPMDRNRHEFKF